MSIVLLKLSQMNELMDIRLLNLDIRAKYGINIVAIKRGNEIIVSPQASEIIHENDILNCNWSRC